MDGITFAKYLLVMAGATYAIRAVPLLLFRRPIRSRYIRSVLHYAPYAVLGAMTFPDILYATASPLPSGVGLVVAFVAAWKNLPMVVVALLGSAAAVAVQVVLL
ncbi:MAG: AzlD domain-containing protein [Oscillospiraceae bacterium]|jgi:branched-subunit amino acid transport protein|nr:AzlD domain-containing protein [Oscillospiraceae bacterium]